MAEVRKSAYDKQDEPIRRLAESLALFIPDCILAGGMRSFVDIKIMHICKTLPKHNRYRCHSQSLCARMSEENKEGESRSKD